jgi:hypothetical protein
VGKRRVMASWRHGEEGFNEQEVLREEAGTITDGRLAVAWQLPRGKRDVVCVRC